jgi:RNA polymerase sigma factor (sigma-70 family)
MSLMPDPTQPADITTLLRQWQAGDSHAYDLVMSWAYQRMLAIAAGFAAQERMATEPAALVNFFSVVAVELRRILVDQARNRVAQKREGSQRRVPMSDDLSWVDMRGQEMLDLDRALTDLEKFDADKVRLVELRYLMGCTVPEICELRGVSDATIERHLRFARTWLYDRLHSGST